jgi:hypothetical protein
MSFSRSCSRFAFVLAALTVGMATLASCGGEDLVHTTQNWVLTSVDNNALPATVPGTDGQVIISSGTSETNGNGHYTFSFTGTEGGGASMIVGSDAGGWSVSQSTLLFRSSTSGVTDYIAAVASGTFRVDMPGQLVGSTNQTVSFLFTEIP